MKKDYPFCAAAHAVLYDSRLTNNDKIVYFAYRSRCIKSNGTFVGEDRLTSDLNMSLGSVRKSVSRLLALGLIAKRRRLNKSSVTDVIDVHNLYDDLNHTLFGAKPKPISSEAKSAQKSRKENRKKKTENKRRTRDKKGDKVVPSTTGIVDQTTTQVVDQTTTRVTDWTTTGVVNNKIKRVKKIKSEVDKDPPAGDKTQTYEKARDGSRYEYRRLKNLPGDPQSNLEAFVTIAAKQCAEHGIEQEDHIITAVGKGIACLADWKEKEYLRDTVACFRKVIGNIVYDISQKVRVEYEPESASDGWPGLYDNPEE